MLFMKLETIQAEWETDSVINQLQLADESNKIPRLHSKYWKILILERAKLKTLEAELKCLTNDKFCFFLNGHDEDTRARGWELPARGKIVVKDEAKMLVDTDKEVVDLTLKVSIQREKCLFVEDIIKNVHNRSFIIRNTIEFIKFQAGG